jgi:heat shock protein HslJ
MKQSTWTWVLPLLALQGLSACSPMPAATPQDGTPDAAALGAYHWQLREALDARGTAQPGWTDAGAKPVQLRFAEGRLAVARLCNGLSASYRLQGGQMEVGPVVGTMMACPDPALMALESRVGQQLPQVQGWAVQPPAAAGAAPRLTLSFRDGTRWQLEGSPTDETRYGSAGERIFLEVGPERAACPHPLMRDYRCLQVRSITYNEQGLKTAIGPWENFYDEIQGYTHQPGVRNVLRIQRYKRTQVPADASAYAYVLDMVVETGRAPP